MSEGQYSQSFQYHSDSEETALMNKMLQMQRQYDKLKRKYENLKNKNQQPSISQVQSEDKIKRKVSLKDIEKDNQVIEKQQPQLNLKVNNKQAQVKITVNDQSFCWNQTEQNSLRTNTAKEKQKPSFSNQIHNASSDSENSFCFQQHNHLKSISPSIVLEENQRKQNLQSSKEISLKYGIEESVKTDSFSYEDSRQYTQKNRENHNLSVNENDSFIYKGSSNQSSFNYQHSQQGQNAESFNFMNETNQIKDDFANSRNFKYNEAESVSFQFNESSIQVGNKILIQDGNKRLNKSDTFVFNQAKAQDKQVLNGSQASFKFEASQVKKSNVIQKFKSQNVAIVKKDVKLIGNQNSESFEVSGQSNDQVFEYNLREFSFRLPDKINEPNQIIELNIQQQLQPITEHNPIISKEKKTERHLQRINQAFQDGYESEEQERIFLNRLINKLSLKKKVSVKELKKVTEEMRLLVQTNWELIEIYETGTYELDFIYKGSHVYPEKNYLSQILKWNRILITQLSIHSRIEVEDIENLLKKVQFPSLTQVTIQIQDSLCINKGQLTKYPSQEYSISYLRFHGISKKLRTLSLKGQTMPEQVAKDIVDMNFPNLRSLYIGFEAKLTNEIVSILTCNKFNNFPKCEIFIANWEGQLDQRFRLFYDKVKFLPLNPTENKSQLPVDKNKKTQNEQRNNKKQKNDLFSQLEKYFE